MAELIVFSNSEEEAQDKAEALASANPFDWGDGEDQTMDVSVQFDRAEVTSEIEEP